MNIASYYKNKKNRQAPPLSQDKNKYFTFSQNVYLVKGAKRGALYDLNSGDIYSICPDSVRLLEKLKEGKSIQEVCLYINWIELTEVYLYLEKLEALKLGKIHTEKGTVTQDEIENYTFNLDFIWLEITENCNLKCLHCYNESFPEKSYNKKMVYEDWIKVLKEAREMGCKKVQFIGGEPLLFGKGLFELINFAMSLDYDFIEVFTNGTLLDSPKINYLATLKVNIAISLYGHIEDIHESITQTKGSYYKTLTAIKEIKEANIPLRIAVTIMKQNEHYLIDTLNFLRDEIGIKNIQYDIIRPSGRGCNLNLLPEGYELYKKKEPKFPQLNKKTFIRRIYGHNCFLDKLCITFNGRVIPCIMERDLVYGTIYNETLKEIIQKNSTKTIRMLSKDYIKICQDCEYRYGCADCRVRSKGFTDDFYSKPPDCLYNPYTGTWG